MPIPVDTIFGSISSLDVPFPNILSAIFDHDIKSAANTNHDHMNRTVLSTFKSEICMGLRPSTPLEIGV
jgi:hypothetical protein